MTFKKFLESKDALDELNFTLALRKEFKLSKEDAEQMVSWLNGNCSYYDLGDDIVEGPLGDLEVDQNEDGHPIGYRNWDEAFRDAVGNMLWKKYNLDVEDLK